VRTATVRGIARALGVSPATVSRSLNNSPDVSEAVRARVLAEARRLGYETPRKSQGTGRIGIVYFNETSGPKYSGYDAVIWGGVTLAATALKYDVVVMDPLDRGASESFSAYITRKGVDGLIIRVDQQTRQFAPLIAEENVPHIVVADRFEDDHVNYVSCNSYEPSKAAVEHLLHMGHRRIAVCHNTVLDTDHEDRIAAYKAALTDSGIPIAPELIIAINADVGGGGAALNRLLSAPQPPTAVFFTDPALTVGALRRALEIGISVPDELSIVGVDDERLRKMTYPVYTAVCQDAAELGYQAGRWLCNQLASRSRKERPASALHLAIKAFLEINQTTAPPPDEPVRVSPTGRRIPCEHQPPPMTLRR